MPDLATTGTPSSGGTVSLSAPVPAGIYLVIATPSQRGPVASELETILSGANVIPRPAGPDKWLVVVDGEDAAAEIWAKLAGGLGPHASVLDQTDGRALITAEGGNVREMLAKGTGMEIDAAAFPEGASAMTAFGHLTIHVTHRAADSYDLIVMSSFAGALWESLRDAAREFGGDAPEELPGLI